MMTKKTQKKATMLMDVEELEDKVEVENEAYKAEEATTILKRSTTKIRALQEAVDEEDSMVVDGNHKLNTSTV